MVLKEEEFTALKQCWRLTRGSIDSIRQCRASGALRSLCVHRRPIRALLHQSLRSEPIGKAQRPGAQYRICLGKADAVWAA
jgi:hypothetical protein